jgi:dTDP-4-amino-4,6-dideoxygalactose transaminase
VAPSTHSSAGAPIPFGRPWLTDDDRRAVAEVLDGHILTHGPRCTAFEEEFAAFLGGGVHCVTVTSCMAALHLAWLDSPVGPGDEVVVAAQTHVATAHAVEWVGARCAFADCDPLTGNVTPRTIEAAITPRTRGIALVHYLGIPCDMPAIRALADRHGLWVVEDCALSVGARFDGVHTGLVGDAGTFSFYPVKHLTTGEGGMFVTRHADVAERVRRLRAFGVDRTHAERTVPGMYDVPTLGLNYRMSELQAALGRAQLRRAPRMLAHRARTFAHMREALRDVEGLRVVDATDPRAESAHYCMSVVLEGPLAARRGEVVAGMAAAGVGTSIYYPQPVPRMGYYRDRYGWADGSFPAAEELSDASVALPVGPHVGEADAARIAAALADVVAALR